MFLWLCANLSNSRPFLCTFQSPLSKWSVSRACCTSDSNCSIGSARCALSVESSRFMTPLQLMYVAMKCPGALLRRTTLSSVCVHHRAKLLLGCLLGTSRLAFRSTMRLVRGRSVLLHCLKFFSPSLLLTLLAILVVQTLAVQVEDEQVKYTVIADTIQAK